jgi:uncharacterized protein YcbX
MKAVGVLRHLSRYPLKSMQGEELRSARVEFNGLPGDRLCAFVQTDLRSTFPWLTGREMPDLLRYRASYQEGAASPRRHPEVEVTTPGGERLAADSESLRLEIERACGRSIRLHTDHRGNHDAAYLSIITTATLRALCEAGGVPYDQRRFRMNLVVEGDFEAFSEGTWAGRILKIGSVQLAITEPDRRCVMITLHPETGASSPALLRATADRNGACAGVYASVLVAGELAVGEELFLEARER